MNGGDPLPSATATKDARGHDTTKDRASSLSSQQSPAATLTSFAPFVTPRKGDTCHDGNKVSLPKSRLSQQTPSNELDPDRPNAHTPKPVATKDVAKRDLLEDIITPSKDADPLFTDRDVDYYRQHPVALEEADHATLVRFTKRYPMPRLLKTFGRDMARKDAELTDMRRRLEDMASLFKDHLTTVHGLSRLEADKTLHNMTTQLYHQDDLYSSLENAANSPMETVSTIDMTPGSSRKPSTSSVISGVHGNKPVQATATMPPPPLPSTAVKQIKHTKSMWSMFGGRVATPKSVLRTDPKTRARTSSTTPHFTKVLAERDRGSSVGSASAVTSLSDAGPVELNAIVDSEELPPLLTAPDEIKSQYPEYSADIYGFIIDSSRIDDFVARQAALKHVSTDVDTPVGSVASDTANVLSETEQDMVSWTSYLRLDTTALGSLSWLPIASPKPNMQSPITPPEEEQDPARDNVTAALQKQILSDHNKAQRDRTIPWERFMTFDSQPKDQPNTAFLSALLKRQTPANPRHARSNSDAVPGMRHDMSKDSRLERTRLIMGGVPQHLRSKIWSQYVNEYMMHEPDEYRQLVQRSKSIIDDTILIEIADDIPRTLTNNVFFRSGKGRVALEELLRAYIVKKPEIGYCQGMNLIGGYLLLALPSTETAYWIFCYMIEHVLAETYFDATLRGASIEIAVLRSYVRDLIPALARHMDELDVADPETVPYNWFLTAFASTLPIEALYRVWDVVLALPTQRNFLLRFAIALLKANEEALLTIEDPFELRDFMDRKIGGPTISVDGLIKASSKLGHVMKEEDVRKRRRHYAFKIDEPPAGR